MPKQIWKFPVISGRQISLPKGARIISAQMQHGAPHIWAIVDTDAEKEVICLHVAGTGHDLPENVGRFIDTFQMEGGALVFHVFELNPHI